MNFLKAITAAAATGILAFFSFNAQAQGFYAKLGGGYNFGAASNNSYNRTHYVTTNNGNTTSSILKMEGVKINLGKGIQGNGAIGYMFNSYFGAELGVGYLMGGENTVTGKEITTHNNGTFNVSATTQMHAGMLLLQPSLTVYGGSEKINPYARFGVILAKGRVYLKYFEGEEKDGFITEVERSGGWGTGMQGAFGFDFKIRSNASVFTETTMTNLGYSPKKQEVTRFEENGIDRLPTLTTNQREIEYLSEFEVNGLQSPPEDSPRKEAKFNMPFSSIGLGIGLKYNF